MVATLARPNISGITEGAERQPLIGFDWDRDYGGIYRKVPSAFWLAPDGDEALPATDGPSLRPAASPDESDAAPLPTRIAVTGRSAGASLAMLCAGPIFVLPLLVTLAPALSPAQLLGSIVGALAASIVAVPFGIVLGALPILVGTAMMGEAGKHSELPRRYSAWAAVGALMGLAIAGGFDAGIITIPLVLTSLLCALIVRYWTRWDEVVDEPRALATTPAAIKA